ncbi:metal-sulfur cluster assembly factor [Fodinibius sediminis]|uniref:Metal-sulfur cluster biosynthetic enzyme n=1 Tax=Fodinibius sediminis TaxID=1214077 RepID=A0A521BL11_9BACT|nr:iron-sulfur cluster assembly protein [Fodinibius sediminis]SMO47837.1 Metal-sulfur cluster biosynthetic enzyme [Fodinibius sediminis]
MDSTPIERREIVRRLRDVIDPELGVNIVDLGLVYNILFGDGKVLVEYTVTTPGCPMRRYLQQQIEAAVDSIDGTAEVSTKVVWEPEWSVDMIKEEVTFFAHPPPMQD